tara:strand:+ start:290 stop:1345 length:1056 start_codon:yes stop_codon:yes gene_type:complete
MSARSTLLALAIGASVTGFGACVQAESLETVDAGRGDVSLFTPDTVDEDEPKPLILWLHGFGGNSAQENYFDFRSRVDELGFLLCTPDGTEDAANSQFWNATDACCDLGNFQPDDSEYLRTLIETIISEHEVDLNRIHVTGYSNGGFMSHRMACDHADLIASIASLAGVTHLDPTLCVPSEPVHVLQMHGTLDSTIEYGGGCFDGCHPSAIETVRRWASEADCSLFPEITENIDIDAGVVGAETIVERYDENCVEGGSSELWTIVNGGHGPLLTDDFGDRVLAWLYDHPKASDAPSCPADLIEDGVVDGFDLSLLLAYWGQPGTIADLNQDGTVGGPDLAFILGNWGVCNE